MSLPIYSGVGENCWWRAWLVTVAPWPPLLPGLPPAARRQHKQPPLSGSEDNRGVERPPPGAIHWHAQRTHSWGHDWLQQQPPSHLPLPDPLLPLGSLLFLEVPPTFSGVRGGLGVILWRLLRGVLPLLRLDSLLSCLVLVEWSTLLLKVLVEWSAPLQMVPEVNN